MGGKMRGECVERLLNLALIGDLERAPRVASQAVRCASSANSPWT